MCATEIFFRRDDREMGGIIFVLPSSSSFCGYVGAPCRVSFGQHVGLLFYDPVCFSGVQGSFRVCLVSSRGAPRSRQALRT